MSISVHIHNEICKGVLDLYLQKNSSLPCNLLCKGQGTKSNCHTSKTAIDLGKYEYRTLLIKSWTGFFCSVACFCCWLFRYLINKLFSALLKSALLLSSVVNGNGETSARMLNYHICKS